MTGRGDPFASSLLPIFFPQSVLGLALLLWFNMLGLQLSWMTAVFAHLVWIVPVVTLVIAIQVYSFDPALEEAAFDLGATRWQVLKEVTLPVLFPGLFSGALFAFLLSWNPCRSTPGADRPCPSISMPKWLQVIRRVCPSSAPFPPSAQHSC
jgi:spermidine/putrescine transport system permease protein